MFDWIFVYSIFHIMSKKLLLIVTLLALTLGASAQRNKKSDAQDGQAVAKYGIKSGIIITETDMSDMSGRMGRMGGQMGGQMGQRPQGQGQMGGQMGRGRMGEGQQIDLENMKNIQTVYFDDYGAKQAIVSEMGTRKTRSVTDAEGSTININEEQGTATRMPAMNGNGGGRMGGFGGFGGGMSSAPVNFIALDDKTVKKNKIKELGEEEVAGKMCKIYSVRVLMMQQYVTNKYWVYQGIVLKSETQNPMSDEPMVQTVTRLEENAVMPDGIFDVPEGIEIREMNFRGGQGGGFGGGGFGGGQGGFGGGQGGFGGGQAF